MILQWICIFLVVMVILIFWYSLNDFSNNSQKELDTTKLKKWLNHVLPLPEREDISNLDKIKRKRKYKPKSVIKSYYKK